MEQRTVYEQFPALSGVVTHAKQFTRLEDRTGSAAASAAVDDTQQVLIVNAAQAAASSSAVSPSWQSLRLLQG